MSGKTGTLYLIPTNLSEDFVPKSVLPDEVISIALQLDHYIAENAKSARAFLKALGIAKPLQQVSIVELPAHGNPVATAELIAPLLDGHNVGLVSEAGAPGVADPGALVVAAAHASGIAVTPLVGPSAILLGLMASGLNGQKFAFHGYLPQEKQARVKAILELERESRQRGMTQLFIETPYRNQVVLADLLASLAPGTRLCVAIDLTGTAQKITMQTVSAWRRAPAEIAKVPALFLLLA